MDDAGCPLPQFFHDPVFPKPTMITRHQGWAQYRRCENIPGSQQFVDQTVAITTGICSARHLHRNWPQTLPQIQLPKCGGVLRSCALGDLEPRRPFDFQLCNSPSAGGGAAELRSCRVGTGKPSLGHGFAKDLPRNQPIDAAPNPTPQVRGCAAELGSWGVGELEPKSLAWATGFAKGIPISGIGLATAPSPVADRV